MGLYDIINNLQQKSDGTKKKILVGLIFLSFVLLALLWTVSFKKQLISDFDTGPSFIQNETATSEESEPRPDSSGREEQTEQKILGPLASLKNGFILAFSDIKEKTGEFLSKTEDLVGLPNRPERPIYKLPIAK